MGCTGEAGAKPALSRNCELVAFRPADFSTIGEPAPTNEPEYLPPLPFSTTFGVKGVGTGFGRDPLPLPCRARGFSSLKATPPPGAFLLAGPGRLRNDGICVF